MLNRCTQKQSYRCRVQTLLAYLVVCKPVVSIIIISVVNHDTSKWVCPGEGFSVAFDPLDGSSIVDTNFTVGTIFGVWPGDKLVGVTGRDQV